MINISVSTLSALRHWPGELVERAEAAATVASVFTCGQSIKPAIRGPSEDSFRRPAVCMYVFLSAGDVGGSEDAGYGPTLAMLRPNRRLPEFHMVTTAVLLMVLLHSGE